MNSICYSCASGLVGEIEQDPFLGARTLPGSGMCMQGYLPSITQLTLKKQRHS